jgi:hypothetical protein
MVFNSQPAIYTQTKNTQPSRPDNLSIQLLLAKKNINFLLKETKIKINMSVEE